LKDDKKINITEDQLTLSATSQTGNKTYFVKLDFYAPIVPSKTKKMFTDRELVFLLYKKTPSDVDSTADASATTIASTRTPVQGFWPRLLVEKKYHWLKTDFNRWKDEDDVDNEGANDFGGDDMFGGGGGFGGGGFGGNQDLSSMMQQMEGFNPNGVGDLDGAGLEDENAEPDSDDEELPDLQP